MKIKHRADVLLIAPEIPLGNRMKAARALHGWTQPDVAYLARQLLNERGQGYIRITPGDISSLETGFHLGYSALARAKEAAILDVLGVKNDID